MLFMMDDLGIRLQADDLASLVLKIDKRNTADSMRTDQRGTFEQHPISQRRGNSSCTYFDLL